MRLLGCALTHCVIAQETNIVRGEGERKGKICDISRVLAQIVAMGCRLTSATWAACINDFNERAWNSVDLQLLINLQWCVNQPLDPTGCFKKLPH